MGIERDAVPRYEHWKNGKMERVFRTLQGRMLAMLTAAQLPLTYWGEAALTAGFLFNLTTSSTLPTDTTPFEILKTTKPDVSHLRTWGVRCFAHVPVELQTKLGNRSVECLFMGYPPGGRGYRVRSLATNHFFDSGNVIFDENIPYHALHEVSSTPVDYSSLPFPPAILHPESSTTNDVPPVSSQPDADTPPLPVPPVPATTSIHKPTLRATRTLTEGGRSYAESIQSAKNHLEKLRANKERRRELRESGRTLLVESVDDTDFTCLCREGVLQDLPDAFGEADGFTAAAASLDAQDYLQRDADSVFESALLSLRSDVARRPSAPGYDMTIPPANHREAMLRSDAEEWKKVEEKELGMLKNMGVYVDEILPEGRKAIGNRWVFEYKINPDGGPVIPKARLVAQGFSQVPFVDYDATFAPVAKSASVRFVAVYSSLHGWHLECFDATRAFLWGDLTRTIYMRYPPGYVSPSGLDGVWRLLKSLYGLKQASLIWYNLLRKVLGALGFLRSEFDHAVFIYKRPWGGEEVHCLLAMHVDDGMAGCTSMSFLTFIKGEIKKAFGIKDLGPLRNFLGVQFERNVETCELWIHQEMFIDSLLAEYDLTNCNPVKTPIDSDHPFGLPTDVHAPTADLTRTFQRIVGSLLFLQICSRPDISFAVLILSQHCASPEPCHLAAAKRVLRYLKGTRTYRLHYGGESRLLPLSGLTDADWAGDKKDRASISGFVWSLGGGPVSWSAKKTKLHCPVYY
jgi:Reverse transcriptase (RNA-dependent DNA polymerase)